MYFDKYILCLLLITIMQQKNYNSTDYVKTIMKRKKIVWNAFLTLINYAELLKLNKKVNSLTRIPSGFLKFYKKRKIGSK